MSYLIGGVQTAVVSLTANQIKNLYASPVTIVGAPGTGFFLVPLTAYIQTFPGTQMFASSGALLLGHGTPQPVGPIAIQDNPDVDPGACYAVFKEPPFDNGCSVLFDNIKKNDQLPHKIALTLSQASAAPVFTLTQVSNPAGSGSTTYTGTITGGAGNAFAKYRFTVTGFTNSANNGTFVCSSSTGTTLVVQNADAVAETHAATATSQSSLYTGTITGFASYITSGSLQRSLAFTVTGFVNSANNGTFQAAASSATTIVLHNAAAVNETHAAIATSTIENLPLVLMLGEDEPEIGTGGAIATAKIMSGSPGTGYNVGDQGDIDDGGSGTLAHYTVNTLTGGAGSGIATFTLNSGGGNSSGAMGYFLNQSYNDTNPTGGGSGAKFVPLTVTPGNGTGRMILTYTVLPV